MATADHFLDRYLDPVTTVLTPQVAQRIVDLEPEQDIVARVRELGEKADAGIITCEEQDEYRALADAGTLMAIFKAKARRYLAGRTS
jgi:hypothetical protein